MRSAVRSQVKVAARSRPAAVRSVRSASSVASLRQRLREGGRLGLHQQRGVAACLRQRGAVGGDHGRAARHRLQAGKAEALVQRRHGERERAGVEAGQEVLVHVAEAGLRAAAQVAAARAGDDQVDAVLTQRSPRLVQGAEVLARAGGAEGEHVGPAFEAVAPSRGVAVGVRAEPLADAVGHHLDLRRVGAEQLDELALGELGDRDQQPGPARDRGQQAALVGDVEGAVGLGMPQRRDVVDHDHVAAAGGERGEVGGGEDQPRLAGGQRQHGLLPGVAGLEGEPRGRHDHLVAVGAQPRQALRQLARDPLDPADLGAGGGAGVDRDWFQVLLLATRRRVAPASSSTAP